jgi:hypothetical protein
MRGKTRLGIAVGAAPAATGLGTGCSSAPPPPPITAHGSLQVDYSGDTGDNISDGDQVAVINSAGTVIANTTLSFQDTNTSFAIIGDEDNFTFTVKMPGGLPRYGIQIDSGQHGTVWETPAQMKAGPSLSLDETDNTGGF